MSLCFKKILLFFSIRTAQAKAVTNHACSAIKASQAVGWTPLVVGGKISCCRFHF
jgi:hypothetical protein